MIILEWTNRKLKIRELGSSGDKKWRHRCWWKVDVRYHVVDENGPNGNQHPKVVSNTFRIQHRCSQKKFSDIRTRKIRKAKLFRNPKIWNFLIGFSNYKTYFFNCYPGKMFVYRHHTVVLNCEIYNFRHVLMDDLLW